MNTGDGHTLSYKARKVSQLPSSRSLANVAIEDYIRPVNGIEGQIKTLREQHVQRGEELPLEQALALRQQKSKPIMEQFKAWVDKLLPGTPPKSALGQALYVYGKSVGEAREVPGAPGSAGG